MYRYTRNLTGMPDYLQERAPHEAPFDYLPQYTFGRLFSDMSPRHVQRFYLGYHNDLQVVLNMLCKYSDIDEVYLIKHIAAELSSLERFRGVLLTNSGIDKHKPKADSAYIYINKYLFSVYENDVRPEVKDKLKRRTEADDSALTVTHKQQINYIIFQKWLEGCYLVRGSQR